MIAWKPWPLLWNVLRIAMGLVIVAAILAQFSASVRRAGETGQDMVTIVTNFYSFFTILSNVIAAVALLWAGNRFLARRGTEVEPRGLATVLACTSTYMIITGIVYNALLRGITLPQGSEPIPWSNEVLHLVGPIFLLADVLIGPLRRALPWRTLWIVIAFPIVWVVYTLVRGPLITNPTNGDPFWYPYPFLNPNNPGGWGSVAIYVAVISIAFIVVGSFVIWWGRRSARVTADRPAADPPRRSASLRP